MKYNLKDVTLVFFSDIDGTIINNNSFCYGNNIDVIKQLLEANHYVIFNSSKTFNEIDYMLKSENLSIPFICETGGGIYCPKDFFDSTQKERGGYDIIFESVRQSSFNAQIKETLTKEFKNEIVFFDELSLKMRERFSGLSGDDLERASNRDFSLLFKWHTNNEELLKLKNILDDFNLTVIRGGRFFHICSGFNKYSAMQLIMSKINNTNPEKLFKTVGLGDSSNDIDMLNQTDYRCIVQSTNNTLLIAGLSNKNFILSSTPAPEGWQECVENVFIESRRTNG
tara:strand:+ start:511 stop:1359 length:849 start_codon:yes stop_codon:yes gene_type:complete